MTRQGRQTCRTGGCVCVCARATKGRVASRNERKATCVRAVRTVLLHGLVEQGHRPGRDVVAAQRQGPGPGLPVQLLRQRRVAREGAVRRAAEALRPQRPRQAPRPPPRPLQRAHGAPRERERRRAEQRQQLPRERRRPRVADGAAQQCCLAAGRHGDRLAGRGARWPVCVQARQRDELDCFLQADGERNVVSPTTRRACAYATADRGGGSTSSSCSVLTVGRFYK